LIRGVNSNADFDSVSELWFDGVEQLGAVLAHPYYLNTVVPDEKRFANHDNLLVMLSSEQLIPTARPRNGGYKLMHFQFESDGERGKIKDHEYRDQLAGLLSSPDFADSVCHCVVTSALSLPADAAGGFANRTPINQCKRITSLWFDRADDISVAELYWDQIGVHSDQRGTSSFALLVSEVNILPITHVLGQ
jgi:EthD domain